MKILTLSIKQKYFDEIVAGTKKTETREVRATNAHKYIYYTCEGVSYSTTDELPDTDDNIEAMPIKYDALKLLTGAYTGKRPYILIEVTDAEIFFITDKNGEVVKYEHKGENYLAAEIDYTLGKIITHSNFN